jgi:hypothetical protein
MKIYITALLISLFALDSVAQNTITYTKDESNIANPERGFCKYLITFPTPFEPITDNELQLLKNKKQSIVLRYFYLSDFFATSISQTYLDQIETDFKTLRKNGFKAIIRFGYKNFIPNTINGNPVAPYLDAPNKTLLLQHINQLKPYLLKHADVILTLQNGFWGTWGENFYTDFYGFEGAGTITAQNWADRKEILDLLLTCIPTTRTVSVRTPQKKAQYFNQNIPQDTITFAEAFNGTGKTRSAAHNDCFLADFDDYTFSDTPTQKKFWAAESKYMIMGGETCNDNPIFTNCINAKKELERFHWTHCNDGYEENVLNRWRTEGCYDEIEKRLGYRLFLQNATYNNTATVGGSFEYAISLRNEGYAAPVNPRKVEFVFKNNNTADSFKVTLNSNPQYWFGGENINLSGSVIIPSTTPSGNYKLYLNLPDPTDSLKDKIAFNIRLANIGVWETSTARNDLLHSVTITGALPISLVSFSGQQVGDETLLFWNVTSSSICKKFEIEYCSDVYNFTKVGKVDCSSTSNYSFKYTSKNQPKKFFRLKMIDTDDSYKYSNIVKLIDNNIEAILVIKENPVINQLNVKVAQPNTRLVVFNNLGKQIFSSTYNIGNHSVNTSTWPKGVYFLQAITAVNEKVKIPFVKL